MESIPVSYISSRNNKPPNPDGGIWGVHRFFSDEDQVSFTATGVLDSSAMVPGLSLTLAGTWEQSQYGKQFKFSRYHVDTPRDAEGVKAFLRRAPGIGSRLAEAMYRQFGDQSIEKLINSPDLVSKEIPNLLPNVATLASETLRDLWSDAEATLPLISLLSGIAFPRNLPKTILATRCPDPVAVITRNPFWLMRFSNVGFKRCDALRIKLKLPHNMPERYQAAALQAFHETSDSVWIHWDTICLSISNNLDISQEATSEALKALYHDGLITRCGVYLALSTAARDEQEVSRMLGERLQRPGSWPDLQHLVGEGVHHISQHQYEASCEAFRSGHVAYIVGCPGTGKTHLASFILRHFPGTVAACAPTHKAALQLTSLLRTTGIEATTIHKLLEPLPVGDGWRFNLDGTGGKYVKADLVLVDESSMIPNNLLRSLLAALAPHTHVLFLGDINQLTPVGRGSMLRDWIHYADHHRDICSYGELTEIRRNAGRIVTACKEIRNGQCPQMEYTKEPGVSTSPNLQMALALTEGAMASQMRAFVKRVLNGEVLVNGHPVDPIRDVQFLVALNEGPHISRDAVNSYLQKTLNPNGAGDHKIFKVGDKVICLDNCKLNGKNTVTDKQVSQVEVSNGALGIVRQSCAKHLIVEMYAYPGQHLQVPTGADRGSWDLGYAITGHKSQGSEWPIVFTFLGTSHRASRVIGREWVYTCISRAQSLTILCGSQPMLRDAVKRVRMWDRKSFFDLWLTQALPSEATVS